MSRPLHAAALALALLAPGCKVEFTDVGAAFATADAAWFAGEETLFVFYEAVAAQGLGAETVIELTWTTDDGVVEWIDIEALPTVHTHLAVDCGVERRCGSTSLHVPREPRDVALRLRYHREGALTLDPETRLNVIGPGPAHTHRSLLVYGVFDEDDRAVQWRARHRFPTLRNEEAERLGLRRRFTVDGIGHIAAAPDPAALGNPYLYGAPCADLAPLEWGAVESEDRAAFSPETLPAAAFAAAALCARATVEDATGTFEATAFARKNPEVRPAFPLLRSPVREATPVKYLLSICDRTISAAHLDMQQQRLLMEGIEPVCIDDLTDPDLADEAADALLARFRRDLETVRAGGDDMVLAAALHHDDRRLGATLEPLLAALVTAEGERNSPRLAGVFLLDSYPYEIADATVGASTIWCPSSLDFDFDFDDPLALPPSGVASLVCAVPDFPLNLSLGPFDLGGLPILPSREQFLDFIDIYGEDEAGSMSALTFKAPELPPDAEHLRVPPFGVATFFNDEIITAEPDDAFSHCPTDGEFAGAVFRAPGVDAPLPIAALPDYHAMTGGGDYPLGLSYDFPYLLEIEYVAVAAVGVTAVGFTLPIGFGTAVEEDYGSTVWRTGEFPIAETLTHCRRFCHHPTFDAAGIYQVDDPFAETYRTTCYAPDHPARGDGGFPRDP